MLGCLMYVRMQQVCMNDDASSHIHCLVLCCPPPQRIVSARAYLDPFKDDSALPPQRQVQVVVAGFGTLTRGGLQRGVRINGNTLCPRDDIALLG